MINLKRLKLFRRTGLLCLALLTALSLNIIGCSDSSSETDSDAIVTAARTETKTSAISWITDYQQGLNLAQQQNKPILIVFTTTWCPPCLLMKEKVYPDPKVVEAAQDFVPILIDPDNEKDLARQFKVTGIPAYFILNPDGSPKDSFVGYLEPKAFIAKLQNALQ